MRHLSVASDYSLDNAPSARCIVEAVIHMFTTEDATDGNILFFC